MNTVSFSRIDKRCLPPNGLRFELSNLDFVASTKGYMEDDLMEDDLKSFFRPFSNLKNWIMT